MGFGESAKIAVLKEKGFGEIYTKRTVMISTFRQRELSYGIKENKMGGPCDTFRGVQKFG